MLKKVLPVITIIIVIVLLVGLFLFHSRSEIGPLPNDVGAFSIRGIVSSVAENAQAFTLTASSGLEVSVSVASTTSITNISGRRVAFSDIQPGVELTTIGEAPNSVTLKASSILLSTDPRDEWEVKPDTLFDNSVLPNSYTVTGMAARRWFEGKGYFSVEVLDANGELLSRSRAYPLSSSTTTDEWAFTSWISFAPPKTATGTVTFNKLGEKDHVDEKIMIPVRFAYQLGTIPVQLYYQNTRKIDALNDACSVDTLLPVVRNIPETKSPIRDVINELIKGQLTDEETSHGFVSAFPLPDFTLASSTLSAKGVLTLEFNAAPGLTLSGGCRAALLVQQIQKTMQQFKSVKSVVLLPQELFSPAVETEQE